MEYEIADEGRLFDPSTNPSLARSWRPGAAKATHLRSWAGAKKAQKAVLIPEEDEQPG